MANNEVVLWEEYRSPRLSALAVAAITPGDLVELTATGAIQRHGTAADTSAAALFAVTNTIIGRGIEDDYAAGDTAHYVAASPGNRINARLEAAANVAIGAQLESAGNGQLQALTTGKAIAEAEEAKDNSAGGTPVRIRVRII